MKPAFLRALHPLGSLSEEKAAGALNSVGLRFLFPGGLGLQIRHFMISRADLVRIYAPRHTHTHTQPEKNTSRARAHARPIFRDISSYIFLTFRAANAKKKPAHHNLRYFQLCTKTRAIPGHAACRDYQNARPFVFWPASRLLYRLPEAVAMELGGSTAKGRATLWVTHSGHRRVTGPNACHQR